MKQISGAAPWLTTRRARTRSILHQMLNDFFLHDPGDERNLFCTLTMVETEHEKLAIKRRLGGSAMAVAVTSSGASALGMALA
jgi:hypothetical protein